MSDSFDSFWVNKKLPLFPERLWELYHENSKNRKLGEFIENQELIQSIHQSISEGHQFIGRKRISLPKPEPLNMKLDQAILNRRSCRSFKNQFISLKKLSSLLYSGYGIQSSDGSPRKMRSIPSAGRLFPLEIYIWANKIKGLNSGLYHYNPLISKLEYLKPGDHTSLIKELLILNTLVEGCSGMLFVSGVFNRTAIKYEERGYRYTLLEAGHFAQNVNLAASSLKLGVLNIGGFFDTKANEYLEIDGVEEATLYLIAFGNKKINRHDSQNSFKKKSKRNHSYKATF